MQRLVLKRSSPHMHCLWLHVTLARYIGAGKYSKRRCAIRVNSKTFLQTKLITHELEDVFVEASVSQHGAFISTGKLSECWTTHWLRDNTHAMHGDYIQWATRIEQVKACVTRTNTNETHSVSVCARVCDAINWHTTSTCVRVCDDRKRHTTSTCVRDRDTTHPSTDSWSATASSAPWHTHPPPPPAASWTLTAPSTPAHRNSPKHNRPTLSAATHVRCSSLVLNAQPTRYAPDTYRSIPTIGRELLWSVLSSNHYSDTQLYGCWTLPKAYVGLLFLTVLGILLAKTVTYMLHIPSNHVNFMLCHRCVVGSIRSARQWYWLSVHGVDVFHSWPRYLLAVAMFQHQDIKPTAVPW